MSGHMEMSPIMLSFQDIVMQTPLITLITLQETILYPLEQVIMEDKEWMIYMCIYQVSGCGLYMALRSCVHMFIFNHLSFYHFVHEVMKCGIQDV